MPGRAAGPRSCWPGSPSAAILPTLVEHGIPFLTTDITGARSELTGIPIQLVRVALPGLAGILLFELVRTLDRRRRWLAGLGIVAIAGFTVAAGQPLPGGRAGAPSC